MNQIKLGLIIASVVIVAVVGAFAIGAFSTGQKVPNVKFIDYSPEGTVTITQGQQISIRFNIVNNEPLAASDVSVVTSYDGALRVFQVDRPSFSIAGTIGANGGRTGQQVITVTSIANDQVALESNFNLALHVGKDVTDSKIFKVRLEK